MTAARPPRASKRRVIVVLLVAASVAFAFAQRFGGDGPWWLELSRFLPYPMLLAPAVLAVLASFGLRWPYALGSMAALVVVAAWTTGWVWNAAPDSARPAGSFRLMTWNAKAHQAAERAFGTHALAGEIVRHDPDIVVMQDASKLRHLRAADAGGSLLGYPASFHFGQYIVASRLPLRECAPQTIGEEPTRFDVVRCMVDAPGGPVLLVTAHFQSPRSGLNAARREGWDGIETWRSNHETRLAQADALARALAATSRATPFVVAGDLNAPPSSPVLARLLATGVIDAFAQAGRGFGHTYGHVLRPAFSFLRIDYVLTSPEIAVDDAFVGGKDASDHRPVIADLRRSGA